MRRLLNWKLWTAAAALAVALFAAGGYFGLPALARWGIETVGSRELGRALKVEQVRANPFLLELTATGLTMADADPAVPPWLSVDSVTIDLSAASLWQRAPVLDALTIDGLRARIVRSGPQRFNFSDIIERLQARPKPADSKPARFALYNIALARSSISIDDRVTRQQHALTDIALNLPFVSSIDSHREIKLQPSLALRADGTAIELKGETLPFHATRESTLRLNLKDVDLPRYLPYVPVRLNFDIPRGKLDTDLQIAFRQPEAAAEGQPARAATLAISARRHCLRSSGLTCASAASSHWPAGSRSRTSCSMRPTFAPSAAPMAASTGCGCCPPLRQQPRRQRRRPRHPPPAASRLPGACSA
jgi:hypothetical protein